MSFISLPNKNEFYRQVWVVARQIPFGKVATYGQIAQMITPPGEISPEDYKAYGPRWIGDAMAACPDDVPWYRVINSQGKITNKSDALRQRLLLEKEGLQFVKDKIDLKLSQWGRPDEEKAPKQATLF